MAKQSPPQSVVNSLECSALLRLHCLARRLALESRAQTAHYLRGSNHCHKEGIAPE